MLWMGLLLGWDGKLNLLFNALTFEKLTQIL